MYRGMFLLLCTGLLAGCQAGYYAHLALGQYELLTARRPIAELLQADATRPELKARLQAAQSARAFAVNALGLPDNDSYTVYADLKRPYVLWNVFAAAEFSMAPHEWCHALVGCLAYRGYYDPARARVEAGLLRAQGLDVDVAPVPAYSTLGWFDDPVLNTMLHGSDDELAGTLFHELAHQRVFVNGDTAFSESFASFVEQQGLRQYLAGAPERLRKVLADQQRHDEFAELILQARARLEAVYAAGGPDAELRAGKQSEFTRLRVEYQRLKDTAWNGDARYDRWMAGELNNARLLPFGLYDQWVPAFAALFQQSGGRWPEFYAAAHALAERSADQRLAALETLAAPTALLR